MFHDNIVVNALIECYKFCLRANAYSCIQTLTLTLSLIPCFILTLTFTFACAQLHTHTHCPTHTHSALRISNTLASLTYIITSKSMLISSTSSLTIIVDCLRDLVISASSYIQSIKQCKHNYFSYS